MLTTVEQFFTRDVADANNNDDDTCNIDFLMPRVVLKFPENNAANPSPIEGTAATVLTLDASCGDF